MICQKCHKNVATSHFTEIINGKSTNVYLCEGCANLNSKINNGIGLDGILASLMGFTQPKLQYTNKKEELICPKCKMGYNKDSASLKPKVDGICDNCGETLITRSDDNEETFKIRIEM